MNTQLRKIKVAQAKGESDEQYKLRMRRKAVNAKRYKRQYERRGGL